MHVSFIQILVAELQGWDDASESTSRGASSAPGSSRSAAQLHGDAWGQSKMSRFVQIEMAKLESSSSSSLLSAPQDEDSSFHSTISNHFILFVCFITERPRKKKDLAAAIPRYLSFEFGMLHSRDILVLPDTTSSICEGRVWLLIFILGGSWGTEGIGWCSRHLTKCMQMS